MKNEILFLFLLDYLSRNSRKVCESKKVDQPDRDDDTNEVLTNKVDCGEVDGEEKTSC